MDVSILRRKPRRVALAGFVGVWMLGCAPRSDPATSPGNAATEPQTRDGTGTPADDPAQPEPARDAQAETSAAIACGETTCTPPEQCISHPAMTASGPGVAETCGIPCDPAKQHADCPAGKHCVPIADGPGPVCR